MSNATVADGYPAFFGSIGSALSMILTGLGTSIGISYCGTSIATAGTFRPENIVRSLIPVIMASIISIYGLIVSIIIAKDIIVDITNPYIPRKGFIALGAGLSTGLTGIAGGYAIGSVGYDAVIANAKQPKLLIGMVLILIFAEVLAVFGLVVGLIMVSK